MVKEAFVQYGLPLLAVVVSCALSRVLHKLSGYLHQKAQWVQAEGQSTVQARVLRAAEILTSCAADGVLQVEAKLRPVIKEVSADGQLTPEGAQRLREQALALAWAQARSCYGEALKAGGFETSEPPVALLHLIESAAAKYAGDSRTKLPLDVAQQAVAPQP